MTADKHGHAHEHEEHGHSHSSEHDHGHGDHGHSHSHGHQHAQSDFGAAFAIGTILNLTFVAVEVVYGVLANSMALLADAGHNFGDVLGLIIAWIASTLVRRRPSARYTYGFRSSSILAALFNAVFLLLTVGAIAWEAIRNLAEREPVAGGTIIVVALIGVVVNGGTALLFMAGRKGDLNIRGAFLHMAADAGICLGVAIAGIVIVVTGWSWVDPVVSLAVVALIVWGTWGLLRDSINMSLAAVPPDIDPSHVERYLSELPGVRSVHDLHIWPMSTTETALTCHLCIPGGHPADDFYARVASELQTRFRIAHTTLQIEISEEIECALKSDHVV